MPDDQKSASAPADTDRSMRQFVEYARKLKGDEKGEAQLYLDRLFRAFGHAGTREAGAVPEDRVARKGRGTGFIDLHWPQRVLFEMKKKGEPLERHYDQAFQYWMHLTPNRPPYVVLCNFTELWIYDFNAQLYDPVDRVPLEKLPARWDALKFLLPEPEKPNFENNRVDATREAVDSMAQLFKTIVARGEERRRTQRFLLQSLVAMFSEDVDLLPRGIFNELCRECREGKGSTYDVIGGLFRQMNEKHPAKGGRYQGVQYFNGGLFSVVEPIELREDELYLLAEVARQNWSRVNPAIFGALFQGSMDEAERHAYGAHFTSEADIQRVVEPTITRPWRERIEAAETAKELTAIRVELRNFTVLDPACGSGNFLYVAYRELKRLERALMAKIFEKFSWREIDRAKGAAISPKQFFGIDVIEFAVELARVTMVLAKETSLIEAKSAATQQHEFQFEDPLPLDNLDSNIVCADALFVPWPEADAIIGNPPYLDARKITMEHGADYSARIREAYPDVPGRADLCVYWFRKAHDHLPKGMRAGLVGTNSIRQNYSREGSLDYIVADGGTITDAVSTMEWPGEAVVHVSIVNWIKGKARGPFTLSVQDTEDPERPWRVAKVSSINSALSESIDLGGAKDLRCAEQPKVVFEGQQPGHRGFVVDREERDAIATSDPKSVDVLFSYVNGDQVLSGDYERDPSWVIDFGDADLFAASKHKRAFERVKSIVLPTWQQNAEKERAKTGKATGEHQSRLKNWWRLKRRRSDMLKALDPLGRYIACSRVTKRSIFWFLSTDVHPDSALSVFALEDDYSFGIISSNFFWLWIVAKGSSFKGDPRFTPDTAFVSFPWPQSVTLSQARTVAAAARRLRQVRAHVQQENECGLRDLYRLAEQPGSNPIKDAHAELDGAVADAYGIGKRKGILEFLLDLNGSLASAEDSMERPVGPGIPPCVKKRDEFVSKDCIEAW